MDSQNVYRGFKDLNCWKEARILRTEIADMTKKFPEAEKKMLSAQIVRASRSVTANIAEGYGRFTYTDTRHFFIQARGSMTDILDHISVAIDENYITDELSKELERRGEIVFKLINGYIAYLDKSKANQNK